MNAKIQDRLAADYGFKLHCESIGNNGARVVPTSIDRCAFDGGLSVQYRASHPEMDNGAWAYGSTSLATMHHWLTA